MPVLALEWKETARTDLLAIIDYISDDNPDAAQRLKDHIDAKPPALPSHPNMGRQGRVSGTREMVVHENYIVVYSAGIDAISVLRILHAAQAWPP